MANGLQQLSVENECEYFLWLFSKHGIPKSDKKQMIWSLHWDCEIQGIPFVMIYDEDYGFVFFCVAQEYLQKRDTVTKAIIDLINRN